MIVTLPATASPPPGHSLRECWERRGHPTAEAGGVLWARHRDGPVYVPLAPELQLSHAGEALAHVLAEAALPAVRAPVADAAGPGGVYLLDLRGYSLARAEAKTRRKHRRGLEACVLRPLELSELQRLGLPLNLDTLARQGRRDDELADPARWATLVGALGTIPDLRVMGAFVNDQLALWITMAREGDTLRLLWKCSSTASRELHVDPALDLTVLTAAAAEPGLRWVVNGHVATLGDPGLDRYKRYLGFTVQPHRAVTRAHPVVAPLLGNRLAAGVAHRLQARFPSYPRLALGVRLLDELRAS